MRVRFSKIYWTLVIFTGFYNSLYAQSKVFDLDNYPSVWKWDKTRADKQWTYMESVRQEIKRIFPELPTGLEVSYQQFYASSNAQLPGNIKSYIPLLKIKDFEYDPFAKKVKPEAVTGCWIYFIVNTMDDLPTLKEGRFSYQNAAGEDEVIHFCKMRTETDARGNKLLYSYSLGRNEEFDAYYFSYNQRIPMRTLNKRELFTRFQEYVNVEVKKQIKKIEAQLVSNQKKYDALSVEERKQETYWPGLLEQHRKDLKESQDQIEKVNRWYKEQMTRKDLGEEASVNYFHPFMSLAELDIKNGLQVWVHDPGFFDSTKPQDKPQVIFLRIRRQKGSIPKEKFIAEFKEKFNMDVLASLTGDQLKQPGGINTINTANTAKAETKAALSSSGPVAINAEKNTPGAAPEGWRGMDNIQVVNHNGNNWFALTKPGFCYPKQFGRTINDGFNLRFDLAWNKEISYYTGHFAVTFAELGYDNALQGFTGNDNRVSMEALYDSYTPGFNRIVLRFDPYHNKGGSLQLYVQQKTGTMLLNKQIDLPTFTAEKKLHRIEIIRSGDRLLLSDDGKLLAEWDSVFNSEVRYNAYLFSRYKVNNDTASDMYFLNNIVVNY